MSVRVGHELFGASLTMFHFPRFFFREVLLGIGSFSTFFLTVKYAGSVIWAWISVGDRTFYHAGFGFNDDFFP